MKTTFFAATVLASISSASFAYDSDPGYGTRGESSAIRLKTRANAPTYYYKPTQRYYGRGYLVTYRYVQWSDRLNRAGTTVFDNPAHAIPATAVQPGTAIGARVTYYHSAAPSAPAGQAAAPSPRTIVATPEKAVPPIAEGKK